VIALDGLGKMGMLGRLLSKAFDKILTVTAYTSGIIIVLLMLSMCYEVVLRYFFDAPTKWAADFSGYMQYVLVLLGAAWVLKIDAHTKIDILLLFFSPKTRTVINIVTSLFALVACALFLWKGAEATWDAYQRGDFLYREVELPLAPLYAVIPFAFLLVCIEFGRKMYDYWRSLT
jgi:TRAP-type C4-dicarboxylate transport system permease small subunit